MERTTDLEESLWAAPTSGFLAHVSWRPGEGWRLWVSSWGPGETPSRGHSSTYTSLTADELVDVFLAEQATRCEWLRS